MQVGMHQIRAGGHDSKTEKEHNADKARSWIGPWRAREEGKPPGAKREKGKYRDWYFHPDLTSHRHRAHAHTHDTKRNNFPLGTPSSDSPKRIANNFFGLTTLPTFGDDRLSFWILLKQSTC